MRGLNGRRAHATHTAHATHAARAPLARALIAPALVLVSALALCLGCDNCDNGFGSNCDHQAPAVPTGVGSITGDTYVVVYWNPVYEADLAGYWVYRSYADQGPYTRIGEVDRGEATEFIDDDLDNGETYFYAVDAFDYCGNESDLSYETVDDTPRPEGWDFAWYERYISPSTAGIVLLPDGAYGLVPRLVAYNSTSAQYYLVSDGGCLRIVPCTSPLGYYYQIQDYGYTSSPDNLDEAPTQGWSACADGVEAILYHTYVLRSPMGYYGKLRIEGIRSDGITIYWAYQGKQGSTELAPARGAGR